VVQQLLNVHVPEFQIYGEDPEFIYDNVQLCALKISVLNYMFKVRYMYENSNFILYQRVMIVVPEISKVKLKINCLKLKLYTYLYLSPLSSWAYNL
jgi:hypothetical protein